ncbi:hypothetical protein D9M69_632130 [compost metagenome]
MDARISLVVSVPRCKAITGSAVPNFICVPLEITPIPGRAHQFSIRSGDDSPERGSIRFRFYRGHNGGEYLAANKKRLENSSRFTKQ